MFRAVFLIMGNDCSTHSFCRKKAILRFNGKDLMSAMLDGTCLMNIDMSGMGADDSLIRTQGGVDDGEIGLRAAKQEMHFSIGTAEMGKYHLPGLFAPFVEAVAAVAVFVGVLKGGKDGGMSAVIIVVVPAYHGDILKMYRVMVVGIVDGRIRAWNTWIFQAFYRSEKEEAAQPKLRRLRDIRRKDAYLASPARNS